MALADSMDAIGAVTELLQARLQVAASVNVSVGRPETAASGESGDKLNLFLYRVGFDPQLRNVSLDDGQPPPLWLTLHYLLTGFHDLESDIADAHKVLGKGLAALHGINYLHPDALMAALAKNPEPLKITFDDADTELLSKIMQGSDEKYRVSAAFQVRPVLIAPPSLGAYAPAVTRVGPTNRGPEVVAAMGATLNALVPERFEAGTTVVLSGDGFEGFDELLFGVVSLPLTVGADGTRSFSVPSASATSPGAYPVMLARPLASGGRLTSNAALARLLPRVDGISAMTLSVPGGAPGLRFGSFTIDGRQLGGPEDAIFVAFYRDGRTRLMLELAGTAAQTALAVSVPESQALAAGDYVIVLRVNGEQALAAPQVSWS